jgi:thioredoxin-like negative regulator of GroEL
MNLISQAIEKAEGFLALGLGLDAWESLEDLPTEAKKNHRVLELRLEILCHEKEWEKASILGESITAVFPRSAQARFCLAVARFQTGDVELARDALGRGIELDSGLRLKALDEPLLNGVWCGVTVQN